MIYLLNKNRRALTASPSLAEASRTELRVLVAMLELSSGTPEEIAKAALCTEHDALAALQFWRGAGAICIEEADAAPTPKNEKKPMRHEAKLAAMGSEHTAAVIEENELSSFLDACQQTAGQVFTPNDIEITIGLFEQLGLSPEYILTLVAYCYGMDKRSMAYVEKVAFSFVLDKDIKTPEALNAHIEALDRMHSAEGKLRSLFGIGERALTKKEKDAFFKWLNEFGYKQDMIEAAYDQTVNSTGRASVPYADKILSHWHAAGCKTVKDAEECNAREAAALPKKSKKKEPTDLEKEREENRSFEVDDFFKRALERSYGKKKDS